MKIALLVVGKTDSKEIDALCGEYVKRLSRYGVGFSVEVLPDIRGAKSLSETEQKQREGVGLLSRLQAGDIPVLLDPQGKEFSSPALADYLQKKMNSGVRRLVFIVGGPYGFSEEVYRAVPEAISLSKMTFSHQMVRLVFIEQLYRAFSILNNSPYHHL